MSLRRGGGAPIGALVKIGYDGDLPHGEGNPTRLVGEHVLRSISTGRLYLIVGMREQTRGKHAGRRHLTCAVIDELPVGATVHPLVWHPRAKRSCP